MIRTTTPTLELTFLGNDLEQGHATSQTVSSAHIVNRSIQFSQTLIKDLKSSSDQVRLQLHKNCPSTEDIIATEGDIKAVLKDDGTPVFTGYLSTNFSWSVTANGEQALSITLEGVGTRLLNKVYSTASGFFSGTASSAVSSICQACGITVAPEYANILTESVSSVIEAGSTCRSLLDQLCYECNAVYFFNEVGELCISRINPSTFGADTIDSEELYVVNGNAVSVSKTLRQYSNARVIYTELETADNYLVYRNTTGQDATHPYCKLDLPGGNYFDGTEIYTAQQWSEAQADAFREPAVIGAVNAASESEKVGSGEILAISNLSPVSTSSTGNISVNFTAKGGADFSMEVHNTSSVAGYLTRLDLYASIVYAKSTSVIRASATGDYSSKMIDEELFWIHDKSLAQAHANLLCQYHRSAGAKYSFYASRDLELGKVYRLNENAFSGLDVYVLIIGKSFGDTSEIASYSAVGVTSFNLSKDVYYKTEMDGVSAPAQGKPGAPGTTFTPSVSEDGVISWTNDGGQENPPAVSIKGPAGNASKYWGVLNTPPMGAAEGDFFVFGLCGETYETTDEGKIFVFKNLDWEELPLTAENNEKILVAYADINEKKDDTDYFSEPPTNSGTFQYAKTVFANQIIAEGVFANDIVMGINGKIRSANYAEDEATGFPISGYELESSTGLIKSVNGIFNGMRSVGANIEGSFSHPYFNTVNADNVEPITTQPTEYYSETKLYDSIYDSTVYGSIFVYPDSRTTTFTMFGVDLGSKIIQSGMDYRVDFVGGSVTNFYYNEDGQVKIINEDPSVRYSSLPGAHSGISVLRYPRKDSQPFVMQLVTMNGKTVSFSSDSLPSYYNLRDSWEKFSHLAQGTYQVTGGTVTYNGVTENVVSMTVTNIVTVKTITGNIITVANSSDDYFLATNAIAKGYVTNLEYVADVSGIKVLNITPLEENSSIGLPNKEFGTGFFRNLYLNGVKIGSTENRNLLDNAWFTINQRAATAASGSYGVDRFTGYYTVGSNGLSLANAEYFIQPIEGSLKTELSGKVLTFSVLYSDGTIESGTADYNPMAWVTYAETEKSIIQNTNTGFFAVTAKTNITVRAVKVENGDKSTLAYDSIPDNATELLKCQRFFYKIPYSVYATAIKRSGTLYSEWFRFPVEMRTTPSITGSFQFIQSNGSWSSAENLYDGFTSGTINPFGVTLQKGYSGFSNYQATQIYVRDMALSADL